MVYALYLSSLITSAVVASAVALYFWRRRRVPGAIPAACMMMAVVVWSLGYVLELRSTELSGQISATYVQYLGIVTVPLAWFIFSLQYTSRGSRLTRRSLFLLSIVPSVTLVLVWTSSFHDLIWHGRHLETSGPFLIIAKTYGSWFWVHTAYSYLLVLLGTLFLIQRLFRSPRLFREQSIALLISAIIPLVWNVFYVFRLLPIYRIDLTPSAFTISGLIIAWGLFHFRLLDIVPMARETVIEDTSDGVIVLDAQNRFIDINPSAQRIIGYSLSDVIGQLFDRVVSQQPELVQRSYVQATEARGEIAIEKGETRYYYESRISPLHDRSGHLTGRLVILHDITERRLIEEKNKEVEEKAQLASRLAAIGEMASGIAHEINNPLSSVIGYADWLLERDIPKEIRQDLETINRAAKRVADISSRLLTFAGQQEMKQEDTDIDQVIETAIELRRYSLINNNVEVINHFDPNLPKTMANGSQLQEVFLNLIINAETSMKESHGGGTLLIGTETADSSIRISFKDDGLGIRRENLSKIFQPFFTTKDIGKGTGLGLSICHGIINKHGGSIYAESEFGKGATFIIELPVVIEHGQQTQAETPVKEPYESTRARILVVDDESEIQKYLSLVLSKEGHQVETTGDGVEALERVKGGQYDLVLLDIKMPGISGIELYQRLEEIMPTRAKRVIFMTGDTIGGDTREFLSRTEAHCITKPFDTTQLRESIRHVLTDND